MILAYTFSIWDIIQVPFGYLLDWLYQLTTNYGAALILFSIIVKLILLPTTAKSKKSSMKMSRLTPQIQQIQKKYEGDQQKQSAAMQELYKTEGVSMGGSCLWSLLPMLILFPLYTVIREPIKYLLHEYNNIDEILKVAVGTADAPGLLSHMITSSNSVYQQLIIAPELDTIADQLLAAVPDISTRTLKGLEFSFLGGIDLAAIPQWQFWAAEWSWTWPTIGAALLPILSAAAQLVTMLVSQKVNKSLVTNEKGVQDKEAAKNSQSNQSMQIMLYMMPLMTIFIGYGLPAALSLYWLIQSITSAVADFFLTRHYRKVYDAEDAARLAKAMEEEAIEAEKERLRAERRAANPDGITENTSKKKLQQKQQKEQEAARAAAKREYNAKRGIVEEEKAEGPAPLSGIPDRPFAKGRAYRADRYSSESTEE